MHDDDSAATALGALADEPVPMAATTVEQVIRTGKRRLRVQRVATVGGVAAVVAVIAAGTLVLRPGPPDGGVPVASRPSPTSTAGGLAGYTPVVKTPPGVPTAPVTTQTLPLPPATEGQPPPRSQPTITTSTEAPSSAVLGANNGCTTLLYTPPNKNAAIPVKTLAQGFLDGFLKAVHRQPAGYDTDQSQAHQPRPDSFGAVRLIMEDNGGEIVLDMLQHAGSAKEAADTAIDATGLCASPLRKTLADGTILQLYPRGEKAQSLIIFGTSGRTYIFNVIPDTQWPLTEEQLATIADEVAMLG
jgi:hypothetical protein